MSHQYDHNDHAFIKERYPDIIGWIPDVRGDKGKINPHLSRFVTASGAFVDLFHVKPVYYETTHGFWRPLSEITTHHGNRNITLNAEAIFKAHPRYLAWLEKRCNILGGKVAYPFILSPYLNQLPHAMAGLTTTTVYPDPNTETSTFDGGFTDDRTATVTTISSLQAQTSSTYHNDASANLQDTAAGVSVGYQKAANTYHHVFRSGTLFDTSAVGSDSIDSATWSTYASATSDGMNDSYSYVAPVSLATSSNTGWSDADWDFSNWGTTVYATGVDLTSYTTSAYKDYTFNTTGEAAINGSGITKIGWLEGHEIENQTWGGSAVIGYVIAYSADQTGTTNDPKLVVVHTAASASPFSTVVVIA